MLRVSRLGVSHRASVHRRHLFSLPDLSNILTGGTELQTYHEQKTLPCVHALAATENLTKRLPKLHATSALQRRVGRRVVSALYTILHRVAGSQHDRRNTESSPPRRRADRPIPCIQGKLCEQSDLQPIGIGPSKFKTRPFSTINLIQQGSRVIVHPAF